MNKFNIVQIGQGGAGGASLPKDLAEALKQMTPEDYAQLKNLNETVEEVDGLSESLDTEQYVVAAALNDLNKRVLNAASGTVKVVNILQYCDSSLRMPSDGDVYKFVEEGITVPMHSISAKRLVNGQYEEHFLFCLMHNTSSGQNYVDFVMDSNQWKFVSYYNKTNVPDWVLLAFNEDLRAKVEKNATDITQLDTDIDGKVGVTDIAEIVENEISSGEMEANLPHTSEGNYSNGTTITINAGQWVYAYSDGGNEVVLYKQGQSVATGTELLFQIPVNETGAYSLLSKGSASTLHYTVFTRSTVYNWNTIIGSLASLTTTVKTSVVAAINELKGLFTGLSQKLGQFTSAEHADVCASIEALESREEVAGLSNTAITLLQTILSAGTYTTDQTQNITALVNELRGTTGTDPEPEPEPEPEPVVNDVIEISTTTSATIDGVSIEDGANLESDEAKSDWLKSTVNE